MLKDLGLSRSYGLGGIRINKVASLLVVLQSGGNSRADTRALAVVGAAFALAVGVIDAASCDELLPIARAHVLSTGDVRLDQSQGCDGDF